MNKFLKDMLMSKYGEQDKRNPYGSRGGYVTPYRGRDMEMQDMRNRDYGYDMARRNDYGDMRDYNYSQSQDRQGMQDYFNPYGGRHYPPMDYGYDMARGGRNDYGYDYGENQFGKLSKKDYEHWKQNLENEDGSRGEHFKKDHISQIVKQMGLNIDHLGGENVFAMAMNMLYSDFCGVAKKYGVDRPEYYADLAKAFLNDKDYKGNPEEKLWAYYKFIVENED